MVYQNAEELIKHALPLRARRQVYSVFDTALTAYREFMERELGFFNTDIASNIKNRILGYAVERQFLNEAMNEKFLLMADYRSVNSFNYKVLHIYNDNIIINIARTKNQIVIPGPSKYRLRNAQNNRFFNRQLIMDMDRMDAVKYTEPPYYCLITYGMQQDELSHITLFVPDEELKTDYLRMDIKNEIQVFTFEEDEEKEAKVASLKAELINNKEKLVN